MKKRTCCALASVMLLVCGLALSACQTEDNESAQDEQIIEIQKPILVCCDQGAYQDRASAANMPDPLEDQDAYMAATEELEQDIAQEALEGIGASDISFMKDEYGTLCVSCKVSEKAWNEFAETRRDETIAYVQDRGMAIITDDGVRGFSKPISVEVNDQCDDVEIVVQGADLADSDKTQILQGYMELRMALFDPLYYMTHEYQSLGDTFDELNMVVKSDGGDVIMDNEQAQALL